MGRTRNLANLLGADGVFNSTDITAALGYTPFNRSGEILSGVQGQNAIRSSVYQSGGAGNLTRTFKICKIGSHYWGTGGVTVEIWRQYYDGFGYAMYRVSGHTATYYGPGMTLTNIISSGPFPVPTLSAINIVNSSAGTDGWGYVDLLLTEDPYRASVVRVTTSQTMLPAGSANTQNAVVMYPDYTY